MNGKIPVVAEMIDSLLESDDFHRLIQDRLEYGVYADPIVAAVVGELRAAIKARRNEGTSHER